MMPPRILFVSPRLPAPLNSGIKIRISNMLRALSDVADVDLVCFGVPSEFEYMMNGEAELPAWWERLRSALVLPFPEWPMLDIGHYRRLAMRRPLAGSDLFYDSFPTEILLERVGHLASEVDLIWTERLYLARAFRDHSEKIIVDLDDLESSKIGRAASSGNRGYGRYALRRESARLLVAERKAVADFAGAVVCSSEDADQLGDQGQKLRVIPNGVDDSLIEHWGTQHHEDRMVFVGTLNYGPNRDAVQYFCREILPRVLAERPNAILDIVGLNPDEAVLSLQDEKHVYVHANVPDVVPFVQAASVSIVPIRIGGGTRLKILESLALGTPVVSTTVGAEGLELQHGRELLLADDPEEFASAVCSVLASPSFAKDMAINGLKRVENQYLWSTIRKAVASYCQEILLNNGKKY